MSATHDASDTRPSRAQTRELLRARGIQPTQQRVEIAAILLGRPRHCSAEALLSEVNRAGSVVSKATVYNTLKLFAAKGLVREVLVDPSKVFFDSNPAPHQHLYNVETGELTDLDESEVVLGRMPELPAGTEVTSVEVVIRVRSRTP